jgi:hypothetical protein
MDHNFLFDLTQKVSFCAKQEFNKGAETTSALAVICMSEGHM